MSKRRADDQLTKDDCQDDEDYNSDGEGDNDQGGKWEPAAPEVLAKRDVKKARRPPPRVANATPTDDASVNPFSSVKMVPVVANAFEPTPGVINPFASKIAEFKEIKGSGDHETSSPCHSPSAPVSSPQTAASPTEEPSHMTSILKEATFKFEKSSNPTLTSATESSTSSTLPKSPTFNFSFSIPPSNTAATNGVTANNGTFGSFSFGSTNPFSSVFKGFSTVNKDGDKDKVDNTDAASPPVPLRIFGSGIAASVTQPLETPPLEPVKFDFPLQSDTSEINNDMAREFSLPKIKLYEFGNNEWKDCGVGPIAIMVHTPSQRASMVIRSEGTLRVRAAIPLWSATPCEISGDRVLTVVSSDGGKITTYRLRFQKNEDAVALLEVVNRVKGKSEAKE